MYSIIVYMTICIYGSCMYNIVIIQNFGATYVLFHCTYLQWKNIQFGPEF